MADNDQSTTVIQQIRRHLMEQGAGDVGFARLTDGPSGLTHAISFVIPLSDTVIDEITDAPTHTYFHHYRTVNAYIDRIQLKAGLLLQQEGYSYLPIPASQSIPQQGERTHQGHYSHKKAAVASGLGRIGKNALFLHPVFGPRVRLGTIFTDCPLPIETGSEQMPGKRCGDCNLCVKACPAGALRGQEWQERLSRDDMIDAGACNQYMRNHFMKIGRGSVCGICIKACPQYKKNSG